MKYTVDVICRFEKKCKSVTNRVFSAEEQMLRFKYCIQNYFSIFLFEKIHCVDEKSEHYAICFLILHMWYMCGICVHKLKLVSGDGNVTEQEFVTHWVAVCKFGQKYSVFRATRPQLPPPPSLNKHPRPLSFL